MHSANNEAELPSTCPQSGRERNINVFCICVLLSWNKNSQCAHTDCSLGAANENTFIGKFPEHSNKPQLTCSTALFSLRVTVPQCCYFHVLKSFKSNWRAVSLCPTIWMFIEKKFKCTWTPWNVHCYNGKWLKTHKIVAVMSSYWTDKEKSLKSRKSNFMILLWLRFSGKLCPN